jgi:transglutaminase-like putative cysteine protease
MQKIFTHTIVKNYTNTINIRVLVQYLISAATIIICLLLLSTSTLAAYIILPAKVNYHVSKTFVINQPLEEARIYLGLLLPRSGPYQIVDNLSVQWDSEQDISSQAYLDLLKLSSEIAPGDEQVAVVQYDIVLWQGSAAWKAPVDKSDLQPQVGIESNNANIEQAARDITASTSENQAYQIFKFASDHLEYSETGCEDTNVSALEAFQSKIGACVAYSRLMVALCRASGIPAKMIIGTILPDVFFSLPQIGASSIPGSGHAWVEFNAQNSWYLADPSCGQTFPDWLIFKRNDGRHLSLGDYDRFVDSKEELVGWATKNASLQDTQLTSVFASNSVQTEITSETKIRKTWDQRWLNVIIVLIIVVFMLSRLRDRILSKYFPD